jgi:hypothetical protein
MNDKINLTFNISDSKSQWIQYNIAVNDSFLVYKKRMFAVFKHEIID